MISLQSLVSALSKCPTNNKLNLPNQNDSFTQKSAFDFKIEKLTNTLEINDHLLTNISYTMENEIEKLKQNTNHIDDYEDLNNDEKQDNLIPNESLILITENSALELPEIVKNILSYLNDTDKENYYLYGNKNPESFYKSILLLVKNDFIIKNKNGRRNDVLTFKKELALPFESFYKKLNYKNLKIVKSTLINNLINSDNYCDNKLITYLSDYLQSNILIIDIIDMTYKYIHFIKNDLNTNYINHDNSNNTSFLTLIKYSNDTYLPLMNSNGNHYLSRNIINNLDTLSFTKELIREQINTNTNTNTNNNNNINTNTNTNNNINTNTETNIKLNLESIGKYTLSQLQNLCNDNNINIKKQGKNKEINKTKKELYDELSKL